MKKSKKMVRNLILFIVLIIITFYILLKGQDIEEMLNILTGVKKEYIFIAIIAMFLYLSLETVNLGRTLKALKEKSNFFRNFKYVLIGFFFSSITPAASGGQPMQIYYMYKENISVGNSTLALLINLCSFQIITIIFAMISLFINHTYLTIGLKWFFAIGVTLNLTALGLLLIGIFSKRLSAWLIRTAVRILRLFKVRNIEQKQEKLEIELNKYHGSAIYIKQNKPIMIKTLITTFIQTMIYYSIPYWIYCSFGYSEYNILKIITLQSVLYATVSGIPLPGAVGVSEGGFISIFRNIFTPAMISEAMLLNRGVSFYLFVLISGMVVIVNILKNKNNKLKENLTEQ